ncbi:hypothetical protein DFS33DRAFT_1381831 [Desarmillaria ectypa]|nr:hypothetical protein DFS33DRAFT_1381831 [Desarmillaria ectypa]
MYVHVDESQHSGPVYARDELNLTSYNTGQSFTDVSVEMHRISAIVGGFVGAICTLLFALLFYFFCRRRKRLRGIDVVEHGIKHESFDSSSSYNGPQASWFSRMHSNLSFMQKETTPSSRLGDVGTGKQAQSPFARIFQRANITSISRPVPATRGPLPNINSKESVDQDLPFLVIPPSAPDQRDFLVIPVNDRNKSSRRKIQIPPQAVIIGPSFISRQETVKGSISDCSRSSNSLKSEKLDRLPRLSKILPPLPVSKVGCYPSTGTRRPLPVRPHFTERFPRRVEKQVTFAGIETIEDAGLRPILRRYSNSGSTDSHQPSLGDYSGLQAEPLMWKEIGASW